ncbi:MAG: malate dehydrogenase [Nitrospirae bacterium]|nr:malate dehydrogenase [Nitrospirota bacterium]
MDIRKKVSIIGAGNVGASAAQLIAFHGIADVVLFDVVAGMPQGKALDLSEACPLWNSSSEVLGTNDYADIKDSDIVVITAGIARKPGMSRDDLLNTNASVVRDVSKEVSRYCPEAAVIVVTNPMDVMAQLAWQTTAFPAEKVLGMGAILDSARFRTFVARACGVSPASVSAMTMGGHGDQMVPLPRFSTVNGISVTDLLSEDAINAIVERTRNGGAEIVSLLKTGSAFYAPAASIFEMVRAIIFDEKKLLPATAYLDGQYGVKGTFAGVPVILGAKGIGKIVELKLNEEEKRAFLYSVDAVRNLVDRLNSPPEAADFRINP